MENTNFHFGEALAKELKEDKVRFMSEERGDSTIFTLPLPAENMATIFVRLIVDNEDGDSKLRYYLVYDVPEKKWPAMLRVLNKCNANYRYICLSLDDEGDVGAALDFKMYDSGESLVDQALTMAITFSDILDKCIPDIMRIVWASDDENDIS